MTIFENRSNDEALQAGLSSALKEIMNELITDMFKSS